jgi:hypothetical protein
MRVRVGIVSALSTLVTVGAAEARPTAPGVLCQVYPTALQCRGSIVACTTCHTAPPTPNAYGTKIAGVLNREMSFEAALPSALANVENDDADGDGRSNAQELAEGTWPGVPSSVFQGSPPQNGNVDDDFLFRRMSAAFCGRSPSFDEIEELGRATEKRTFLHDRLTTCLKGSYWRNEALVHVGDPLIRAVSLLGSCGQAFLDYEPDYNLFVWAMTDGHDARDLLTAQYFVQRSDVDGVTLARVDALPTARTRAGVQCSSITGKGVSPQNVDKPYRAGMLTTAQFLLNNTQESYMPRVSAGIAYRNWIGADIAQYQALYSVPGEPRDIDKKNVKGAVCASCHATLDPLTYAYAYYYGAGGPKGFGGYAVDRPEVYLGGLGATRPIMDDWYNNPPEAYLFGKPLGQEYKLEGTSSLVKLATEASKSDLFARHVTRLVYHEVLGEDPEPRDADEFAGLWASLRAGNYSVDALCHRIIDTKAFGSPL